LCVRNNTDSAMPPITRFPIFIRLLALQGGAALVWYFWKPSEPENILLMGLSAPRLVVGTAFTILIIGLLWLSISRANWLARQREWLDEKLSDGPRAVWFAIGLGLGALFFAGAYLFTWLFFPAHLRAMFAWLGFVMLESAMLGAWLFPHAFRGAWRRWWTSLAFWRGWNRAQLATLLIMVVMGLAYFLAFVPDNFGYNPRTGRWTDMNTDEEMTYIPLSQMYAPADTLSERLYYLVVYEDYHYGYPFYAVSALALLPNWLAYGDTLMEHWLVNVFVLRMVLNIPPVLIAAGLMSWVFTRFRRPLYALGLFALVLSMHAFVGHNLRFWHPDALVVLFSALTLFLLDRDDQRYGVNFYLAAAACGLAAGTKLFGFFFALAIPVYILWGVVNRRIGWRQALISAAGFVAVLLFVFVVSNPFLFHSAARERAWAIMTEKTGELDQGYAYDPDGIYRVGLGAWLPFLTRAFGPAVLLVFLLACGVWGAVRGPRRATSTAVLLWFALNAVYLIGFVAVKVTHYWLPAFVPLYALALSPALYAEAQLENNPIAPGARGLRMVKWINIAIFIFYLIWNVQNTLGQI